MIEICIKLQLSYLREIASAYLDWVPIAHCTNLSLGLGVSNCQPG